MTPEEELLEDLQREHPAPEIAVEPSSDAYFALLQRRFPVRGSKIDWDRVPAARVRRADLADSEKYFEEASAFAEEVWSSEQLDPALLVVVVGDSAMKSALSMSLQTLRSCLPGILRMPQHTYVLPPDASWCMVFTMEGDLCFGHAPS